MTAIEYRSYIANAGVSLPKTARRASPEEDLQRLCVEYAGALSLKYPLLDYLFHPANGGKRPKGEAGKLKALGVKPGVPDLMLPFPSPTGKWPGMALELKAPKGSVSEDQWSWMGKAMGQGWLVGIVWSFEDFQDYLDIFLGASQGAQGIKTVAKS